MRCTAEGDFAGVSLTAEGAAFRSRVAVLAATTQITSFLFEPNC